jgi:GWxTD domain-containing protein
MLNNRIIACCLLIFGLLPGPDLWAAKKKDPWKQWLQDVDLIMTRMERSVAKLLGTVEEQTRFKEMFWKARDPNPRTPLNEFKMEFEQRVRYANQFLKGVKSDRGRIYVILGKPTNKTSFVGHQGLVECELWNYEGNDRPGLLPFMNLIFFKPRNLGDYQLYHPGIHTSRDLLSAQAHNRYRTNIAAYKELKMNSTELAGASLSIIPGEGDPRSAMSLSSSNFALNRIYTLPEREAELGYIRSFKSPTGTVEVTHSTRDIRGYGYVAVARNKGMNFVHYALMPDRLNLKQMSKDLYRADIHLHINIETLNGAILYQHRRIVPFKADPVKRERIRNRRVVFRDFAPVIEGTYNVVLTFINDTTKEFFTYKREITVSDDPGSLAAVVGYQLKEIRAVNYIPFAADNYLVLTDPRSNFSQKDALEGIALTSQTPQVYLESKMDKNIKVPIETLTHRENVHKFRKPLAEVKDGTYMLTVKTPDGQTLTRKIHVLPYYIGVTRPFVMERPQPGGARFNYFFVLGQQYMNIGNIKRAAAVFGTIPETLWNGKSVPIIAKAFYANGDYARVAELLEREDVKKEYAALLMLANSAIELKRFDKALQYLQQIRKYGDTVEINHLLAATYLSLGDRANARAYYERAKKLKDTPHNNNK